MEENDTVVSKDVVVASPEAEGLGLVEAVEAAGEASLGLAKPLPKNLNRVLCESICTLTSGTKYYMDKRGWRKVK